MNNQLNTLFIGKVLLSYNRLDSTNSQAERILQAAPPAEGTIIFTADQFAGRGQMGNTWFNDIGKNLTISIILYPKIDFSKRQFALNQIIALGLRDSLAAYCGQNVKIKWPNDIYVNDKKIAGVLIQNSISRGIISSSIVGIGTNVNQMDFPEGLGHPTSIYLETQQPEGLQEVLNNLCNHLEAWYLKLKGGKYGEIDQAYHSHLYMIGAQRVFRDHEQRLHIGHIIGVNKNGQLKIETTTGLKTFMFKEITLV